MQDQSLSYGIFEENSLKLTVLNSKNEHEEKIFEMDEDLDVYELIEKHNPKFILFQDVEPKTSTEANTEAGEDPNQELAQEDKTQENLKEQFLNLIPIENYNDAIIAQTKDFDSFKNYTDKSFANWCLTNNLYYIENLTSYTKELTALWTTDRKKFSLEFWKFLRANLGATNLSVLFNYVDEKEKLSLARFHGAITPTFSFATESEKNMYDFFKESLIEEKTNFLFDEDKKQFHLYNLIGTGPVLIWGELESISVLQKTLIQAVFNSLNTELTSK